MKSAQVCARLAAAELWQQAGAVLLFAPLSVGVLGARAASTARALLVGWLLLMQPLGFDQTPSDLFLDFAKHYRARP